MVPFITISSFYAKKFSLISALLACLNEDKISLLIPCDNQYPLFDYGKFVRKIVHKNCVEYIKGWLKTSSETVPTDDQDCRIQCYISYSHATRAQGSTLQEFTVLINMKIFRFYNL